jgi:hypothetical protein
VGIAKSEKPVQYGGSLERTMLLVLSQFEDGWFGKVALAKPFQSGGVLDHKQFT